MPMPEINTPADFNAKGVAIADWARARGYNVQMTYAVIKGRRKAIRGQSFQIAKELGMKPTKD